LLIEEGGGESVGVVKVFGGSETDETLLAEVGNEVDVGVGATNDVGNDEELTANIGDGEVVGVEELLETVDDGEDADVALFVMFIREVVGVEELLEKVDDGEDVDVALFVTFIREVVGVEELLEKVDDGEEVDVALFVTFIVNEGDDE
jgi:hypothetical protein